MIDGGLNPGDVIVTPEGITVYPPKNSDTPWRAVWTDPDGTRRQCRAVDEASMAAKLEPVKRRLIYDAHRAMSPVGELVEYYLNPGRLPVEKQWSRSYRESEDRFCRRFVEMLGHLTCEQLKVVHAQNYVNEANTLLMGKRRRQTLKNLMREGEAAGFITNPRLAKVHWQACDRAAPAREKQRAGENRRYVDPRTLPGHDDVRRLAEATQCSSHSKWWHELMIYTAAYTGLRSGEFRALPAGRIDFEQRTIDVIEQVHEVGGHQFVDPPKGDKERMAMFPRTTPLGYPLAEQLRRRADEALVEQANGWNPNALMFPARDGKYFQQPSMWVSILGPAFIAAGWRDATTKGRTAWTLHTLRHVFCTTAINDWGVDVTDVAVLAGHSNVRITMERYLGATVGVQSRVFARSLGPAEDRSDDWCERAESGDDL